MISIKVHMHDAPQQWFSNFFQKRSCLSKDTVYRWERCGTEASALGCLTCFWCPQTLPERGLETPALPWLCWAECTERFLCLCLDQNVKKGTFSFPPQFQRPMLWGQHYGVRDAIERGLVVQHPQKLTAVFLSHWEVFSGPMLRILDWTFINEVNIFFRWLWRWQLIWLRRIGRPNKWWPWEISPKECWVVGRRKPAYDYKFVTDNPCMGNEWLVLYF